IARETAPLSRPAAVGDVVVLAVAPSAAAPGAPAPAGGPTPAAPQSAGPSPAPPPDDPEARSLSALFASLKGTDLWTRSRRYEEHVRARPHGRYARVLGEEAAALRELLAARDKIVEQAAPRVLSFTAPREALAGAPLRVAIELGGAVSGAVIHVRRRG